MEKKKSSWSSVLFLCVISSTDQWAGLSCKNVSSKCVSCFLNSSSMQQLCHTWLWCFIHPQCSITSAKSLMSCCIALAYLIPQAARLCIYVNTERPESSGGWNKRGPKPRRVWGFIYFLASLSLNFHYGGRFEEVMCMNYLAPRLVWT